MSILARLLIIFALGCVVGGGFVYHFINWLIQKAIDDGKIEFKVKDL